MKSIIVFLFNVLYVSALVYYISPASVDNGTCIADNITLRPCYQFQQLNASLLSDKYTLLLILLPGSHVIPSNHMIQASSVSSFKMVSSLDEDTVVIDCQQKSRFLFQNIAKLEVRSIKFISCSLDFQSASKRLYQTSVEIFSCIFVGNTLEYTTAFYGVGSVLFVACEFDSNNGAILCNAEDNLAKVEMSIVKTIFNNNCRQDSGGVVHIQSTELNVISSNFTKNSANFGGAIYSNSSVVTLTNSRFIANTAQFLGGAVFFLFTHVEIDSCYFDTNLAGESGGVIYTQNTISMNTVIFNSSFTGNTAAESGGAIYCKYTTMLFLNSSSEYNTAGSGGFTYLSNCYMIISSKMTLTRNRALSKGGAIFADESVVNINGLNCVIEDNTAEDSGGAIYIFNSNILVSHTTTVIFDNNRVTSSAGKGGAIFVRDDDCEKNYGPARICFVYLDDFEKYDSIVFIFKNNSANEGSVLYGGLLDRCLPDDGYQPGIGMRGFKNMSEYSKTPLAITSAAKKLCICVNSNTDCSVREVNASKIRGETVKIALSALDQDENSIPATARASYREISAKVDKGEERQDVLKKCEGLNYRVFATDFAATLILKPEGPCSDSPLSTITIHITVMPCSTGFEQCEDRCECDRRLHEYISVCNVDSRSVKREGLVWLRYDEEFLMINKNCPLDYCETSSKTISLSHPDEQCANHRSGVLCGGCQRNYSSGLGGSKCLQCTTSKYTFAWLTVLFAVAGVALVALLLLCNMTISAGTLNGLIFYANVVSISGLTSLQNCSVSPLLSVFIAWVNLDLGIHTCFYSGMDTYYKTWLQFVFPLYVWLLVGAILITSYYSSTAMKIFGRNNIAILATMFILSYTKILKTIFTVFTFTEVLVGSADNVTDQLTPHKVWTHDGNVDYLNWKHTLLFVVALLFLLLLFLPYTLTLLFGQCLRSMSTRRGLKWIHSTAFLSVLDAYHAPYNKKHRYWTGFMLLVRCFLFLVFATNYKDHTLLTNAYTISLVITGILTIKTFSSKIYTNVYINLLELSFLLNLEILSVTLHYIESTNIGEDSLCMSTTVSIAISFISFIGILAYHAHLQINRTGFYTSIHYFCCSRLQWKIPRTLNAQQSVQNYTSSETDSVTNTQLRETLLECHEESKNY